MIMFTFEGVDGMHVSERSSQNLCQGHARTVVKQ